MSVQLPESAVSAGSRRLLSSPPSKVASEGMQQSSNRRSRPKYVPDFNYRHGEVEFHGDSSRLLKKGVQVVETLVLLEEIVPFIRDFSPIWLREPSLLGHGA